ncbi:MAG: TetR/AcrR family transcriptional regulator, partial [Myxococcota bacterium]
MTKVRAEKERRILQAAREAFFAAGSFMGASMDLIAKSAQVSKPTLYRFFPDKEALFASVIEEECHRIADDVFTVELGDESVASVLRRIMSDFAEVLFTHETIRVYAVSIASSQHFPKVAESFYRAGPKLAHDRLVPLLLAAVARQELDIPDVHLAADQLLDLCRSPYMMRVA